MYVKVRRDRHILGRQAFFWLEASYIRVDWQDTPVISHPKAPTNPIEARTLTVLTPSTSHMPTLGVITRNVRSLRGGTVGHP